MGLGFRVGSWLAHCAIAWFSVVGSSLITHYHFSTTSFHISILTQNLYINLNNNEFICDFRKWPKQRCVAHALAAIHTGRGIHRRVNSQLKPRSSVIVEKTAVCAQYLAKVKI